MTAAAPAFRRVCQLSGDVADQPSKFFDSLERATARAAELDAMREAFIAAIGFYDCPCGSEFEFNEHSTLEDYAALNRWLGQHGSTCDVRRDDVTLQAQNASLKAERSELYRQLQAARDELAWHTTTEFSAVGADDPAADRAAPGAPRPGAAHPTTTQSTEGQRHGS